MKERLKKFWKDPVGSKLIAVTLIALGTSLVIYIKALIQNEEFINSLKLFWNYKISLWIVFGIIILVLLVNNWIVNRNKQKKENFEYDEETLELDRNLFNKIRNELLPQNGAIGFLRENNFAGFSFNTDSIDDVYKIGYENNNSDFEFLNPELETIKEDLVKYIAHFTSLIATQTFPTNSGRQTVPPEWEIEQSERFLKVVDEIHQTTTNICNKYDE